MRQVRGRHGPARRRRPCRPAGSGQACQQPDAVGLRVRTHHRQLLGIDLADDALRGRDRTVGGACERHRRALRVRRSAALHDPGARTVRRDAASYEREALLLELLPACVCGCRSLGWVHEQFHTECGAGCSTISASHAFGIACGRFLCRAARCALTDHLDGWFAAFPLPQPLCPS